MSAARTQDVAALAQAFGADVGALEADVAEIAPNVRKLNTDATRAPLPSDDETQGYAAGSRWLWQGQDWTYAGLGKWLSLSRIIPEMFGAGLTNDDAPAFRAAVAFLAARGGGELHLGERTYRFASTVLVSRVNIGSTTFNPAYQAAYSVVLPFGVSLVGVPGKTRIDASGSGAEAALGLLDWGGARVSGIEFFGSGATGNAMHGVHFLTTSLGHVTDRFELSDLHIHHVGSYGIGHQYGLPVRGVLRNILVTDTGSDGVDWKVRGESTAATFAEGVVFDNIEVRRFGARITDGNATGFGIRGAVQANNIRVYELGAGQRGIVFSPGHSDPVNQNHSITPERSTLTNWYAEGRRENYGNNAAYGLVVWACGSVQVGPGIARWCRVHTQPASSTPYPSLHGPRISAVVIPAANDPSPVLLQLPGASVDVDVQSDHDLFSTKAGTATDGQTVFTTPAGYGAFVKVVLGQATLTAGTDYTVSGDTVTLASGLAAGATLYLVYPPLRAVRVEADCQRIAGHADRWCPTAISYATTAHEVTSSHLGFVADGPAGRLSPVNSQTVIGLAASGPGNLALRLSGSGTAPVEVSRPRLINLPTSAAGLSSGTVWSDVGILKVVP